VSRRLTSFGTGYGKSHRLPEQQLAQPQQDEICCISSRMLQFRVDINRSVHNTLMTARAMYEDRATSNSCLADLCKSEAAMQQQRGRTIISTVPSKTAINDRHQ
jgi:hypothetical protein